MARPSTKGPTDGELQILRVLWDRGSASVREVHQALAEDREVGYTTVLKLMQIMTDKGLLRIDRSVRPQLFKAARSERQTQRQLVGALLDRAFRGASGRLVLQALSARRPSRDEREEIRKLLDRLEEGSE